MRFDTKTFYNFIETQRLTNDLSVSELSKAALPFEPYNRYATYKNNLVGSTYVFHACLSFLQFKTLVLYKEIEGKRHTAYVTIDVGLQEFSTNLFKAVQAFGNKLPYGQKVEILKRTYASIYQTSHVPTFTTIARALNRMDVEWTVLKEAKV